MLGRKGGVIAVLYFLLRALFPNSARRSGASAVFRGLAVLIIAGWSWRYFTISVHDLGEAPGWMHGVHLVFHEAGHSITAMLTNNREAVVFMGSGLQVLFPLVVAGAFYWKNADGVGAALGLWWAGLAALDVAPYIADARALELMLLSGGTGQEVEGHDWEYLLTEWHALGLDTVIAGGVATCGRAVMLLALLWAAANIVYDRLLPVEEREVTNDQ
jgi:predicted heme/steroid binding protein